jgi:hypothetical protein
MTRWLRFTVRRKDGELYGHGWDRPRGATPAHRVDHLMRDRILVRSYQARGLIVTLERFH